MKKELNILMVDDHPIILEGYKKILLDNRAEDVAMRIDTANSCEEANAKLEASLTSLAYDIIFLDIGLPPSRDGEFLSGEDIGRKIRKVSPATQLAVLTMFVENLRLLTIFKSLKPEAFMVKSDVSSSQFLEAFDSMLHGKTYSSQTIQDLMRKQIVHDYNITRTDRDILLHLSRGLKSKEIPQFVPLSLASIEKRKKFMREVFEVEDVRDITLINRAKELGFL
ncbi:DNA-binding response regulator, NarL/FixJ family, contains REC and HTH domains [Salinimicrobium catena]|uniref:DNA-binding response regulator, NarL/FixJ family, contains REC and HTH domains n=1 Tax=Salinimicrobium catena TaxID=390640 RepID=A0A1H5N5Z0_9FLAO|nr:response regulator [Salinimicrobium catena]SDL35848.1 DNA-binding response regulator, NarL/FixJ family, contains REC and HTH domains [Salinimicrobium catena]SEE96088.1 DNA-binding response regulator, NarL/FixJ family, contains REC and HTH domains [Salinimicrobium catena]